MSTTAQIQALRYREQHYPTDLLHNGHQYVRGYKVASVSVNKLREIRKAERANRT